MGQNCVCPQYKFAGKRRNFHSERTDNILMFFYFKVTRLHGPGQLHGCSRTTNGIHANIYNSCLCV